MICPYCRVAVKPYSINQHYVKVKRGQEGLCEISSFLYECPECSNTVLIKNIVRPNGYKYQEMWPYYFFVPIQFSEMISRISPEFVDIYNQALYAEQNNLNKIAGLGYRKALEFKRTFKCNNLIFGFELPIS